MNLSSKQAVAVRFAAANPGATADQIVAAAEVKGGPDNQAAFLFRLLNKGALRVDVTAEAAEALGIE